MNLRARGMALWDPEEFSEDSILPHIRDGLYHLGFEGDEAVGVFRLQPRDPVFWPEMPDGTSAYLHKLAVLPARQGQRFAPMLLHHAVDLTRTRGLDFLRLDCVEGRPSLRAVYENFGFRHHSQKLLGAQVFERFEFNVGAPHTAPSAR